MQQAAISLSHRWFAEKESSIVVPVSTVQSHRGRGAQGAGDATGCDDEGRSHGQPPGSDFSALAKNKQTKRRGGVCDSSVA